MFNTDDHSVNEQVTDLFFGDFETDC